MALTRNEVLAWLREEDPRRLDELWRMANETRQSHVGDAVHLRGLVELSNHCERSCAYCGLRAGHTALRRYRLTAEEALDCARLAERLGYGTVVLQSGEDRGLTGEWIAALVHEIKERTHLAVTLSLGERSEDEFRLWKEAGADRYLLRFETSNRALYDRIHPPLRGVRSDRLALLRALQRAGYETGSGVMVGIPGQRYSDLAEDILMFAKLELDMVGVGPYIAHPDTPLAGVLAAGVDQAPNSELMAYKVVALTRLVCPDINIPSTTAINILNRDTGYELGLTRGANIVMPNLTPLRYRALYEIYPGKGTALETPEAFDSRLRRRIAAIGRCVGHGRGDSPHRTTARACAVKGDAQ